MLNNNILILFGGQFMKKKTIILILILIIIIIGICFIVYNESKNQQMKIGDAYFSVPAGYHEGTPNKMGHVNLTNGNHSIFITCINTTNINEYVDYYVSNLTDHNQSIELSNYKIGKTVVYKTTNTKTKSNHYWFVEKDKLYTVYNWDNNPQMDEITENLIISIKH